jgi:aspartate/methionine/tyrosine aminotransferase
MTPFTPFALEEFMSRFEQGVEVNLTESGVHPLTLGGLLDLAGVAANDLRDIEINYPHVEGIPALRASIAALYPGAGPENVLVTVGAIEANYDVTRALVAPGQRMAVMLPNYLQIWGVARNHGADVRTFSLDADSGWALDGDGLERAVAGGARLIAVCNPNNPTGRVLTDAEKAYVVDAAERSGAWLLADEVYRGAERIGDSETGSFWGMSDRVIAVGSMSKAYGLPGLRIGWAVAPTEIVPRVWRHHEYTTISASMLANHLAVLALSPDVRPKILERTRSYIRSGYSVLADWVAAHSEVLTVHPPDAAAIALLGYQLDAGSEALAERIRREQSVLVVPGALFGVERHLRVSFGLPSGHLTEGLERIGRVLSGPGAGPG